MLSGGSTYTPQQQQQQQQQQPQQPQLLCASALFCPGDELRGLLSEDNFPRQDFANQQVLPGTAQHGYFKLSRVITYSSIHSYSSTSPPKSLLAPC
jgi:hypothetical protein